MNRGRGDNFRGRGRGRVGARASPHPPADHISHYNVGGAEPSSSDYKSCERKERFSPGSQLSWQRKTVSKQAQPVASEASEGQSCVRLSNRDNTACEVNSQELNNQAKSVGSDTMLSGESDMTPDSGHVKSSISRDRSWQRVLAYTVVRGFGMEGG